MFESGLLPTRPALSKIWILKWLLSSVMYIYRVNIGAHTSHMHTHKDDVYRTESCVMVFVVYGFMYVHV